MQKSVVPFFVWALIVLILLTPGETAAAQVLSFPAEMNKSFSPISIAAGGVSRLSVTIFNPNAFQLTNASWTDNLISVQPGLTIASPVGLTNSCGGAVAAAAGSTTLSLSGGTVPAQVGATPGSCTVSINITSTTPGNLINTMPAGALTSTGEGMPVTNTSPASATLHVSGTLPPSVSKSFSPGTIWAGGVSRLSILIRNNEPGRSLTHASLTDNLPANVFLANPVSSTLAGCGASASLTAVSGGTSVTLNNGTIAPNSTCTIIVNVTSNVQGAYTNTIPQNALQNDQNLTNATAVTARLNVREIGLTKQFSPPTLSGDGTGTSTLIITLQNPKATPYTGVSVTDNLPTPLTAVSVSANTCGGSVSITPSTTVSLTGGTIPPATPTALGTCTISVQVTVPAGTPSGRLTNRIPTTGLTTSQGIGLLSPVSANVTVSGTDVSGIKSFSPSNIPAGGNSRLRIEITAPSDTDLTNFSITDNLPTGVTISNSTLAVVSSDCGASALLTHTTGANFIRLENGLILAGKTCRIDVYVTGSIPGTYTNTIPPANITNTENRVPTGDLTSSLTVTGGGNLSIAVVKGFDPLTVFGGSASTMSIQLINPGTVALTGIAFTDNMPNGMILATPLNFNVGTCGGTLSGVSGANSFSFSGGSLPASGTCTLTLSATMTVNGNLTNTISAKAVTTLNGASNPDPAEASLTNLPGASVSKFFSSKSITTGTYSLLTITIQNTGNVSLSGMGLKDTLPGTLPAGLVIANPPAPAPTNNCGGTLSAVAGTQIIQLTNGSLAASSSCSFVVSVTSSKPGSYQNTIPAGTLSSDQGATNHNVATDTLVVTAKSVSRGGGGRGGNNSTPNASAVVANAFIIPVTGFAPGMITKLDTSSRPAYDATSLTIEIPVIKVNSSIVGVESKNGSWDVSWLQNQVGWLNGTAYPTWKGNSVLTAHVVNADGKPGVFSHLKSLGIGEYIFVYSSGYRYTYKVVSNDVVQPNDASVMKHEDKSFLTLITCDSYDAKTGTYLQRVVIGAMLVDVRAIK